MQAMRVNCAAVMVAVAMLAGCATVTTPTKGDPFESYNRTMFTINDKIDQVALKPLAKGYVYVTPQPVRDSVTNFFGNIGDIYTAANNLVQLKIADGVSDIMRVVMNSIFGVAGLFDVASVAGLPKHTQDFGLTLGHYGVPAGPYVVLPLLGPSTVRDTAGTVVDYFGSVTSYVDPAWFRTTLFGVQLINTRANLLGAGDVLSGAALDKYSFVRNAYLQRRQYLIGGDNSASDSSESLPKYEDVGAPPAPSATAAPAVAASGSEAASGAAAASEPGATSVRPDQMVPPRIPSFPSFKLR
ncbi:VacJ family lipoprotein [Caballeronia mineralivorans]|jgi:phospholipid-binding lipoprotein MlaA|uniref:MlaA family lipoprotein n=1 Tax=Caballeronia mineralivorans TaxID=2010198 RepID=UPI0023F360E9|nr:VacJ family lipoprotein [Caballeronia mineralivorans]MDB5785274.1 transporter [Caballeronia mineralivorans]